MHLTVSGLSLCMYCTFFKAYSKGRLLNPPKMAIMDWKEVQPWVNGPSNHILQNKFFDLIIPFIRSKKSKIATRGPQNDWLRGSGSGFTLVFWRSRQLSQKKILIRALLL